MAIAGSTSATVPAQDRLCHWSCTAVGRTHKTGVQGQESPQPDLAAPTQDVLVYQLPHHAHFYAELVNCLAGGNAGGGAQQQHATVTVLFSRCDAPRLEPVVGSARASKMLRGATSTFLFC